MKIQEKPDYLIFADSAKNGECANFPDISRGWGVTIDQTASKPPLEWMNGAFNRVDKNMLYLLQQGVPEWSENVKYPVNAIIKYNGVLYTSIVENDNSNPATSTTKWKKTQAEVSKASTTHSGIVKLNSSTNSTSETEAATPLAVKKVNDQAVTAYDRANIANANAISANSNANNAHNRINAIVDKFEPCVNESRVYSNNKKTYLFVRDDGIVAAYNTEKNKMVWGFDAKGELGVGTIHSSHVVGLSEHVTNMFNQFFGQNGYTKLPNGLIIQWGGSNAVGARICVYPIAFNCFLCSFATSNDVVGSFVSTDTGQTQNPNTQIHLTPHSSSRSKITNREVFISWFAIGY